MDRVTGLPGSLSHILVTYIGQQGDFFRAGCTLADWWHLPPPCSFSLPVPISWKQSHLHSIEAAARENLDLLYVAGDTDRVLGPWRLVGLQTGDVINVSV